MACMMIDPMNFQIIGRSDEIVKCPLTGANYLSKSQGEVCPVCSLCEIGHEGLGLSIQ